METTTLNPVEMSRSISEYGFMIVASACFLFTSITTIFLFYRWYSKILGSIVDDSRQSQKEISETMKNFLLSTKELLYLLKEYNRLLEEQAERQKEQGRMLEEIWERVITPKSPKGDFEESLSSHSRQVNL